MLIRIAGRCTNLFSAVLPNDIFDLEIYLKGEEINLTAKIKYKFNRMLARWDSFTVDERIITICAVSLFLPYQMVVVPEMITVFRALLKKDVRSKMNSVSSSEYIYFSIILFTLPAILFRNWFGLMGGVVLWLMLVFMLYLFTVMTVRFYNNLIDLMLILSLFATAFGVVDKFALHWFIFEGRTSSVFYNANYYGYMLELFVIIALYRFEKRHSIGYLIILFVNLGSILLCDCRTAWVALAVALMFYAVHYKHNVKWVIVVMLVTVISVIVVLGVPMFSSRMAGEVVGKDLDKRSLIWSTAFEWIKHQPIFGYGMNSFREICIRTNANRIRWHSHNLVLNVLLDFGIVGLAYFSCMAGRVVSVLNKPQFCMSYGLIRKLIMVAALATMIHGVTDVPLLGIQTAVAMIYIVSGCSVERNERVFKRLRNFCEIYQK